MDWREYEIKGKPQIYTKIDQYRNIPVYRQIETIIGMKLRTLLREMM